MSKLALGLMLPYFRQKDEASMTEKEIILARHYRAVRDDKDNDRER